MPLQVTPLFKEVPGAVEHKYVTVSLGTYATGGVKFTPQDFKLGRIDFIAIVDQPGPGTPYLFQIDRTNHKIAAYVEDTVTAKSWAQVANATDLSAVKVTLLVIGS